MGAWSSSGVINAIEDFSQYDLDVYLKTNASKNNCVENIRSVLDYVKVGFETPAGTTEVCQAFGIDESTLDKAEFNNFLADIWSGPVQYGQRVSLCDQLNQYSASQTTLVQAVVDMAASQGVVYSDYLISKLADTTINTQDASRQWTW